jgi:hypothetical protein
MKSRTILRLAAVLGLALAPAFAADIADSAKQQIAQILSIKSTFSPAMQKMDSATAFGLLRSRGVLPAWMNDIIDANNTGMVDVEIGVNVTPAFQAYVASLGGTIRQASPANDVLIASIPYASLENLAARPEVKTVSRTGLYTTNAGSVTSQGYISHRAKDVIAQLGFNGAGVKVGVLSDSATPARVAALIASGDLPSNTVVLSGQAGPANGTDEGTAMMEIVHDIAPGAQTYFATANSTQANFAANIRALAAAGCKVIVDDVTYFAEGVFQDGTVAKAVNDVTAGGVTYLSSAANDNNLSSGTSGTWEGDFVEGGALPPGPIVNLGETGNLQMFGAHTYLTISAVGSSRIYSLKWSDPLGGSNNDYDLFITDAAGTLVKAFSAAAQTGTQDPLEILQGTSTTTSANFLVAGDKIVVVLYSGAARALHVGTHRGRILNGTSGATFGHNAAANTVSTAAVYWNSAFRGTIPFTGGPSNPDESFSSDGPRKIFYNPDGTPISADNFLFGTNGGTTLVKPDAAGADGVVAHTPGFNPFFGTSAAAPHLAGIAALIMQACPACTPAQVKAAMFNTALDNMATGIDRDSGYGIVNALAAVRYALAHLPPQ